MPVSYAKLFERMEQRGLKKVDLRKTYKINPKTVDSLVNNRSVTVDTMTTKQNSHKKVITSYIIGHHQKTKMKSKS